MTAFDPVGSDEIVLNEDTRSWVERATSYHDPAESLDRMDEVRAHRHRASDRLSVEFGGEPRPDVTARDHTVGPHRVAVREHRPPGASGDLPAYVYLHGGAFWHGSIDERVNRALVTERAARTHHAVFAVEYRLAPEFPFPAAVEDAVTVVEWLHRSGEDLGIDRRRIVLGGVSAGANIATSTTARLAFRAMLSGLILEVPAIDLRPRGSWDERFARVNGLNSPDEMGRLYAPGVDHDHPGVSPLFSEGLSHFPPTHIVTAEYDPHREGGEILARRLRGAGVTVTGTRHLGALHGSLGLTGRDPVAIAWQDDVCAALGRLR